MPLLETLPQGFIKYDKEGNPIKPRKDPMKRYLILLQGYEEDNRDWFTLDEFMPLQQTNNGVYLDETSGQYKSTHTEIFKELETIYADYNIMESYVFTNNSTMKTCISLYTFMRHILEHDSVVSAQTTVTMDDLNEIAFSCGYDEEKRESLYIKESM